MKHYNKITIALTVCLAFVSFSCEDSLVEEPRSLTIEGFYNTPAEVEAGLAPYTTPYAGK